MSDTKYIWRPDGPQFVENEGFQARSKSTKTILVHHTGVNKDQTRHDIDQYHKNTNGWKGIGYNLLIRRDGTVYNGRGADALGAHAGQNTGYNSISCGVCMTGNFMTVEPTTPQWNSLVAVCAFLCGRYKLNPLAHDAILGHRDVKPTECPGDQMLAKLQELRQTVAAAMHAPAMNEAGTAAEGDPAAPTTGLGLDAKSALHGAWTVLYSYFGNYPPEVREALNNLRHHPYFS